MALDVNQLHNVPDAAHHRSFYQKVDRRLALAALLVGKEVPRASCFLLRKKACLMSSAIRRRLIAFVPSSARRDAEM